jgi:hypothetical protein
MTTKARIGWNRLPADWATAQARIGLTCRRNDSPVIGCVIATILDRTRRRPHGEVRYVISWPTAAGFAQRLSAFAAPPRRQR